MADPTMFAGVLGEIVRAADPHTEADPVGVLASLISMVGVVIGQKPSIAIGQDRHPLLVWPLLFGATSTGRKGTGGRVARAFLERACPEYRDFTVSGLSSGEGLIERIRDPDNEDETRRNKSSWPGTADKRLWVVEEEFSSVMARARREGSTLGQVLRVAWDGGPINVLNRSALTASGSHVGITGHVTPREFRLRLADGDMAGGTYNRFLPLHVERSKRLPIPSTLAAAEFERLSDALSRAVRGASRIQRVSFGDAAARLWCDSYYDEFSGTDDDGEAFSEFTQRAAPYCQRIAALYAVLAGRRQITRADLMAAAALVRYSMKSARYVLDARHKDPRLERIRRAVAAAGDEGLTRTEISALFSRNLPASTLNALLNDLTRGKGYDTAEVHTGGRPATRYRLTPA